MTTVTYTGNRAYVEFNHNGVAYGFARGMSRDDIPEELALTFKEPGFPQWEVTGAPANSTEELLAVVETDDSSNAQADFNPAWKRGEMIKWFTARGESVPRTSTKASLTARAEALLNPPVEAPVVEEVVEEAAPEPVVDDNTEEPEAAVEEADATDSGEGDE